MLLPRRLKLGLGIGVPLQQLLHDLLPVGQRRRLSLLGVLDTDDTALGAGDGPADEDDAQVVVHHHDLEVLDGAELVAHAAGHLLAGHDSTTAALRGTRRTDGSMVLGVTVRGSLAGEAVALHTTGEAHAACSALDVDELALLEPVWEQLDTHGEDAFLVEDLELGDVSLGSNALGLVVSQLRAGDVPGLSRSRTNLHGPVAILLPRLVRNDLNLIELQNRARHTNLAIKDTRHALLGRQHTGPQRCRILPSLERGGGTGGELGQAGRGLVEAVVLGSRGRRGPAVLDAAGGHDGEEERACGGRGGGPREGQPEREARRHGGWLWEVELRRVELGGGDVREGVGDEFLERFGGFGEFTAGEWDQLRSLAWSELKGLEMGSRE